MCVYTVCVYFSGTAKGSVFLAHSWGRIILWTHTTASTDCCITPSSLYWVRHQEQERRSFAGQLYIPHKQISVCLCSWGKIQLACESRGGVDTGMGGRGRSWERDYTETEKLEEKIVSLDNLSPREPCYSLKRVVVAVLWTHMNREGGEYTCRVCTMYVACPPKEGGGY